MVKKTLLTALILLILVAGTVLAEPYSLRIGQLYAYHVSDGVFKAPLFYSNDGVLRSLGFPFMFISTGGPIYPGSTTRAERTYGTDMFNLFFGFSGGGYGGNPDSTWVGMIGFSGEIPPGDGVLAEFWFTGAPVGDMISFLPVPNYPPGCSPGVDPGNPPNEFVHVPTAVCVVEGGTEIICQSVVNGMVTHGVAVPVYVSGSDGPFSLEIVSFEGPAPWDHEPTLNGDNPWTFSWMPGFNDVGRYEAVLRATDATDQTVDHTPIINVEALEVDPCDVARGYLNCDSTIDIADLIFTVDWMFTNDRAPYSK